uniref:Gamma-tubulin complex component n=1 Tax=Echinococcus granulosus TaxID=6210 RepID=A0A068WXU6_ECHGR|nr:hypothetical protein EgrG_000578300 [Echinococcus granulosus]
MQFCHECESGEVGELYNASAKHRRESSNLRHKYLNMEADISSDISQNLLNKLFLDSDNALKRILLYIFKLTYEKRQINHGSISLKTEYEGMSRSVHQEVEEDENKIIIMKQFLLFLAEAFYPKLAQCLKWFRLCDAESVFAAYTSNQGICFHVPADDDIEEAVANPTVSTILALRSTVHVHCTTSQASLAFYSWQYTLQKLFDISPPPTFTCLLPRIILITCSRLLTGNHKSPEPSFLTVL